MEIKREVRNSLIATVGRFKVTRVVFSALVAARTIKQKTNVQTARWETISRGLAGSSRGQYKGNAPHKEYALTPNKSPSLFLLNYLKFVN
jgi:hypothetical protein